MHLAGSMKAWQQQCDAHLFKLLGGIRVLVVQRVAGYGTSFTFCIQHDGVLLAPPIVLVLSILRVEQGVRQRRDPF